MKYYLTTDTHFNHDKMPLYCGRPVNFENIIKKDISSKMTSDDTLIHLGDVSIGKDHEANEWFGNLPGRKILIKGNHDQRSNEWYLSKGWDFVCDIAQISYKGKRILFSHTPQQWSNDFDINIHGHFHNQLPRLLAKQWVEPNEEGRNKYDLSVISDKSTLLALEYINYECLDLDTCLANTMMIMDHLGKIIKYNG